MRYESNSYIIPFLVLQKKMWVDFSACTGADSADAGMTASDN
ncbi:MAG: hypothetical protein SVR08_18195 [Spirochaetota bacterium]|nr:hypothetical protein [Spirochaetota bacterium]